MVHSCTKWLIFLCAEIFPNLTTKKSKNADLLSLTFCGAAGQVCKVLCCLLDGQSAAQQTCGPAIQPIVSLLSHPDAAVVEQACQAIASLVSGCHQNQAFAGQCGAVELLMQLLFASCPHVQQQQSVVHLLLALLIVAVQVMCIPR